MAGKADIVDAVAEQVSDLTKKQVTEALEAIFEAIGSSLADGERVSIPGFGSFSTSRRAAREGRNPATGATIKIAASTNVKFKPGKELKSRVN